MVLGSACLVWMFPRTSELVIIVLFVWPVALGKVVTSLEAQHYSQFSLTLLKTRKTIGLLER